MFLLSVQCTWEKVQNDLYIVMVLVHFLKVMPGSRTACRPNDPPQNSNFANFGPILMKFGVEVSSGEHSFDSELFQELFAFTGPLNHPSKDHPKKRKRQRNSVFPDFCLVISKRIQNYIFSRSPYQYLCI